MAGLIRREDIEEVRSRTRIEDVIGQHVTLRNAGAGSMKGLCPFHEERTPSFHVRPALGFWHCFGCGEGGDVISFVQRIDHLDFAEAVEQLADRAGVTLNYEAGGARRRPEEPGKRQRLLEAHRIAEDFYRSQLQTPAAQAARGFLKDRDFDEAAAEHFSVGYSPAGWDNLTRHLRGRGFTDQELTTAGLAVQGNRGLYDRFRDRLMWPIRDLTGAVIGFGARKLDQDPNSPKYLNTPETPIYRKSQVLYGIDLAKKDIVRARKIVIVEGYTDVMAAHLAGESTAVATCGTAFGSDHVQLVRRLLGDGADPAAGVMLSDGRAHGGEIIFTFDGDEAGKAAARKVYVEDQKFAAQTFVAIEPHGWDPCDLRQKRGDEAVRQLIAAKQPLFEFVLRSVLSQVDLKTAEGRVAAVRAASPILAGIKDIALRQEYIRQFAGWVGVDVSRVSGAVRNVGRSRSTTGLADPQLPTNDPVVRMERQALEALLQRPLDVVGSGFELLDTESYSVPTHRAIHSAVVAAGGLDSYLDFLGKAESELGVGEQSVSLATRRWIEEITLGVAPQIGEAVRQLTVAPLAQDESDGLRDFAVGSMRALVRTELTRQTAELRIQLQRLDPEDAEYTALFSRMMELDARRRDFADLG